METQFHMAGRSGKQCRQRYHNHLDTSIKHEEWSKQEEIDLITHHNAMGNRWAQISRAISGRSQNCVKNKFYSILRRGMRYINSTIKQQLKRYKQLEIGIIYKIVQACEITYKRKNITKEMLSNFDIKKQIIYYGLMDQLRSSKDSQEINSVKILIEKIKQFNKGLQAKNERKPGSTKKEEDASEEIQSAEVRDKCHVYQLQPKKTSLHNLLPEKQKQQENHENTEANYLQSRIPVVHRNSSNISNLSNLSGEFEQARPYDLWPVQSTIRSFQLPEYDMRSPHPIVLLQSPHFDQLRGSINSWTNFNLYHH